MQLTGKEIVMMRHLLIALAAAAVVGTSIIPDDAFARRGGAAGVRGPRGGGVAVGPRGGAVAVGPRGNVAARGGGYGYRGGHPVARGAAWGAAAAGAAAVGAGAYYGNSYYGNGYYGNTSYGSGYNSNCYRDSYGQVICPNQYQSPYSGY